MKKIAVKIIAACMALTILGGCAKKDNENNNSSEAVVADQSGGGVSAENMSSKGRYIEEEIDLPEDVEWILDMVTLDDGTTAMYANTGYYISTDDGNTWEKKEIPGLTWEIVSIASIEKDGSVFVAGYNGVDSNTESMSDMTYLYVDKDGNTFEPVLDLPTYGEMGMGGESFFSFGDEADEAEDMQDLSGVISDDEIRNVEVVIGDGSAKANDVDPEDDEVKTDPITPTDNDTDLVIEENEDDAGMFTDFSDVKQMPNSFRILKNETLLVDLFDQFYVFDPKTGEKLQEYELTQEDGMIETYEVIDDKLVLVMSSSMQTYDLTTGAEIENNSILEEALMFNSESSADSTFMSMGGMNSSVRVLRYSSSDNSTYLADSSGIFRLAENGSVLEQLVIGEETYFSDPTQSISSFTNTNEYSFLTAFSSLDSPEARLMRYRYSEEAPLQAQTELMVYGLYDNSSIRQAVSAYRKAHPEVNVTFQIGIRDNSGITETDALKTLTTEIMAGTGPDILILDGMSVSSLSEKGILVNLEDVFSEIAPLSFENIVRTYESGDGIYAIPTRFTIPYLIGSKVGIDQYSDLSSISEHLESVNTRGFGYGGSASDLTELLYRAMSPSLSDMSTESLADFYTQIQRLYDITLSSLGEEVAELDNADLGGAGSHYSLNQFSIMWNIMSVFIETDALTISFMTNIREDLAAIHAATETYPEVSAIPLTLDGKTVFIPSSVVGISAKSEHPEEAKDFLRTVFTTEIQSGSMLEGFPVIKAAMDNLMVQPLDINESTMGLGIIDEESGITKELEIYFPTSEQTEAFKAVVESVELASITDQIILSIIKDQIPALIDGKSPESAASDALQKIKLYIAE